MLIVAAILPLIFLVYQIVIDWIDLFPWNDVSRKSAKTKLLELIINYFPLLLISYAYFHPAAQTILWGMIGALLYLAGHIRAWWIPYLFGASEKERAEYLHYFAHTYKFLPRRQDHPVPDAEHVVLGCICLLMAIINVFVFFAYI